MSTLRGGPNIVTSGLVFYVDAANAKSYTGSTTFYDQSKNRTNGTLTNGPAFDSGHNGSIHFDATDDYLNMGNVSALFPGTSDYTWNGWLKFGGFTGNYRHIWYGCAGGGHNGFGLLLHQSTDNMRIEVFGTSNSRQVQAVSTSSYLNGWHHWSFVIVQSTFQILVYIDGSLSTTLQYLNWGTITDAHNVIAGSHHGDTYFYDGYIANIGVYSRALTAAEALQNYNALKGRYL